MRKNSKVSKNFGEGDTKIKARFQNEHQAQRVAVLFQYVHLFVEGGYSIDDVKQVLATDIDKCLEVLGKIQTKHPTMQKLKDAPECPQAEAGCDVIYDPHHDQFKCVKHGLLYQDADGETVATI